MVLHLVGSPSDVLKNLTFQCLLKKISKQCNKTNQLKAKSLPEILKIPSNSSQRSCVNASQLFGTNYLIVFEFIFHANVEQEEWLFLSRFRLQAA
jgi:hypothetical protein